MKYFTSDDMTFLHFTSDEMVLGLLFLKNKEKKWKKKQTYHSVRLSPEYHVLWELHASVKFAVCYIRVQMDNAGQL